MSCKGIVHLIYNYVNILYIENGLFFYKYKAKGDVAAVGMLFAW
ncbi:hypothetical protein AB434_3830 [Heyndrickxia coagulans]|uniref:Uncharacterized protein n=1 Tax=Heyndrickxia coagulans TaxID=1398 RepID=A0AAN0WBR0_HEYCO|nr:hypothetical protein SB48_HM08orf02265 [Heyndrickxia coagulans]AKN56235.1 hypothetical protein AB434_3830 [Heyndrickxia coagulans]KYC92050.1 hypothetical protein B4096_3006 [Heyndrickxia coagulans]